MHLRRYRARRPTNLVVNVLNLRGWVCETKQSYLDMLYFVVYTLNQKSVFFILILIFT